VAGGVLAALDVRLPFLISGLVLLLTLGIVLTFKEPRGLPAAYVALAASVSLLMVCLFWKSRQHCPQPVMAPCPAQVREPLEAVAE
jgi:peptidoglycan biosynthesis protein MviN/MurJ (putative lipid II flippase)